MPRGRFPQPYAATQAVARFLGWTTSVATILILAYVGKNWASRGQSYVAGLLSSIIALLNDSWEVAGITDRAQNFPRLAPGRTVLHDLFSLAIGIGGIIMIWISDIGLTAPQSLTDDEEEIQKYLTRGLWSLTAVVSWRFLFSIWGCYDCSGEAARAERRAERRFF